MKRLEMRRSEAHAAGLLNRPSAWILRSPPTLPGLGVHGETVSWDGSLRECGKVSRELWHTHNMVTGEEKDGD